MDLADETPELEPNLSNREPISAHEIRPEDFGYFYPDLYNEDDAPIVILEGKTYYRDLIWFIEEIQDAARHFEERLVKINLLWCLKEIAAQWLYNELTAKERWVL